MPVTVGSVTGLETSGARISTRVVFVALGLLAAVISEIVARCSLAPGQLRRHLSTNGIITNLIPFRTLNNFLISQILIAVIHWFILYFFIIWLDTLKMLNFRYSVGGVSNVASSMANWMFTEMLFVLFCSLTKVKEHTKRKMAAWWQEQEVRREAVRACFQIVVGTGRICNPQSVRSLWQTSHEESVSDRDNQPGIVGQQLATFYPREQQQEQVGQENPKNLSAKYPQFEVRYRSDHDQHEEVTETNPDLEASGSTNHMKTKYSKFEARCRSDHDQYEEDRDTSSNLETRVNTNHLKTKYPQFEARYQSDHDQYEEDRDTSPNLETRVDTNYLKKTICSNKIQLEAVGFSIGHFETGEKSEIKFEYDQTEVRQIKTIKDSVLQETLNSLEAAEKSDKYQQEGNFKMKENPPSDYARNGRLNLLEVRPQNPQQSRAKGGCQHCQHEVTDLESQVKAIWPRPRVILVMSAGNQDTTACSHRGEQTEEDERGVEGQRDEDGELEREKEVEVERYKEVKEKQLAEG